MTGIVGNNGSVVRSFRSRGYGLTSHLFFSLALLLTTASVEICYYSTLYYGSLLDFGFHN